MKKSEILKLDGPALDGLDEIYYISFLTSGEVKFLHGRYRSLLSDIEGDCSAIYRYNYWKIDGKYVNGSFIEIEFGSDEYKRIDQIRSEYVGSRIKKIVDGDNTIE